jgi:hypothetical protein
MPKPQVALDVIPSYSNNSAVRSNDRVTRSEQRLHWLLINWRADAPSLPRELAPDCLMYEQQVQAARGIDCCQCAGRKTGAVRIWLGF